MLTDVEKSINRSYTLTYSRTPMKKPDYSALCDLNASEVLGADKSRLLVVENSYVKAVFGLDPPKGLQAFYNLESGLNESITSPLWSLTSPSVMVDGKWLGAQDMEDMNVKVTVNGSLMVEISVSGYLPGFKVEETFRFYTHSRFFDFKTTLTPVSNVKVDALSVFSAFYRKGVFEKVLLSNGSFIDFSSIPGVRSFDPGNWSMLVGPYGNVYVTIKPEALLNRVVETDIPDYDLITYLIDPSEISENAPLVFEGRFMVLSEVPSLDVLDGEYFKHKTPLVVEVSMPKVLFNVKGPHKVDIYETFKVYLQVITRRTLRRILLNASTSSPNLVCLSKPIYSSFVPSNITWTTTWYFRASSEGIYTINFSLSTWNETMSVLYNIKVVIPVLAPSVDVAFRVVDFDGETAIGDVDLVLLDKYGDVVKTLAVPPSGNITTSVQVGGYKALIYRNGSLIGCNSIEVSKSENITLKTWAYDFNVLAVNEEGKPISDALVVLRPLNQNISAEYRMFSNSSGVARFENIFNGTYNLKVMWRNEMVENLDINVQEDELTHTVVFENWGVKVEISVPEKLPQGIRYVCEPVVFPVYFSYGEAASGSIRIIDEDGKETPHTKY
ncbi:carboxypeptidase regulatory-like domain-containing protein [Candidatus Bathyarchaeota archaeon]|nr:MAG: carboxypeptidase regulatory-like domain-containing protein [Candidatus Bathyarchaeota archaeon]